MCADGGMNTHAKQVAVKKGTGSTAAGYWQAEIAAAVGSSAGCGCARRVQQHARRNWHAVGRVMT